MPAGEAIRSYLPGAAMTEREVPGVKRGVPDDGMSAEAPKAFSGLLGQAAAVLSREMGANPLENTGLASFFNGSVVKGSTPSTPVARPPWSGPFPGVAPEVPPAALPTAFDVERLRRHAHEVIETVLAGFAGKAPLDDRLPLLSAAVPVAAGDVATITLRVANQEAAPAEVSLYCTNFVADSGFDIPALHVTFSPRRVTIPPKGDAPFEVKVAVPRQAPAGVYSGLVQAAGTRYVKAVVSVEVT
jgi:hypothetical protein